MTDYPMLLAAVAWHEAMRNEIRGARFALHLFSAATLVACLGMGTAGSACADYVLFDGTLEIQLGTFPAAVISSEGDAGVWISDDDSCDGVAYRSFRPLHQHP